MLILILYTIYFAYVQVVLVYIYIFSSTIIHFFNDCFNVKEVVYDIVMYSLFIRLIY